jgi:hypothetical protein
MITGYRRIAVVSSLVWDRSSPLHFVHFHDTTKRQICQIAEVRSLAEKASGSVPAQRDFAAFQGGRMAEAINHSPKDERIASQVIGTVPALDTGHAITAQDVTVGRDWPRAHS